MNTNILDFGASTSLENNAPAIQAAIDACESSGGGRVTVPTGRFVTGTIYLKSNVELHLEHGATLRASLDPDTYNSLDAYPENYFYEPEGWDWRHLIIASSVSNVAITGTGTIEGAADGWFGELHKGSSYVWREGIINTKGREQGKLRPGQLIVFVMSTDVRMTDVTVKDSTCWCCFFHGCERVFVRGLNIRCNKLHANTDGIDIDCCKYVTVSDCIIETGDDCIAIRGSSKRLTDAHKSRTCEYVTITNCILSSSSAAIRIGVGISAVKHVRFSNLVIKRAAETFCFCTSYGGSGHCEIDDITFSNISATELSRLFILESGEVKATRISFENIRAEVAAASILRAGSLGVIDDITVRNVDVHIIPSFDELTEKVRRERGEYVFIMSNISKLRMQDVRVFMPDDQKELWSGEYDIVNCECEK